MEIIRKKIRKNGDFYIPKKVMKRLKFKNGEELILKIESNKLIIEPGKKKRLKIRHEIIDELVENEELFEPENM